MKRWTTTEVTVYSPKITEELIPVLYRAAKDQAVPMTALVDRLLFQALAVEPMSPATYEAFVPYQLAVGPIHKGEARLIGIRVEAPLLSTQNMIPFRHAGEVDAWYRASVNGFYRTSAMSDSIGDSSAPEKFLELLADIRKGAIERLNRKL